MSEPDVYEELRRQQDRAIDEPATRTLSSSYLQGMANGIGLAIDLVEFLRWRNAREEWPAEGCRCLIVAEFPDGGVDVDVAIVMEQARAQAKRWRYVLGPCSCAKEG